MGFSPWYLELALVRCCTLKNRPCGAELQSTNIRWHPMPQSFACLHNHIIFSTKNREPLLLGECPIACSPTLLESSEMSTAHSSSPAARPTTSTCWRQSVANRPCRTSCDRSRAVLRAGSAKRFRISCFRLASGYAAFAVSYSHVPNVKKYIATQAEYHQTVTFQDEFRAFLRKHDIEFDEHTVGLMVRSLPPQPPANPSTPPSVPA